MKRFNNEYDESSSEVEPGELHNPEKTPNSTTNGDLVMNSRVNHRRLRHSAFGAGKKWFGRLRSRTSPKRSSLVLYDSELSSEFSIEPKKAVSLLGIASNSLKNRLIRRQKKNLPSQPIIKRNNEPVDMSGITDVKNMETITIKLYKRKTGLGFNVVGGIDNEYIPGDSGFFVSKIRENSSAYDDGRLKEGDRILSVNGAFLVGKRHDEAVDLLKNTDEKVVLVVEPDAEKKCVSKPTNLLRGITSQAKSISSSSSSLVGGQTVRLVDTPPTETRTDVGATVSFADNNSETDIEMATAGPQRVVLHVDEPTMLNSFSTMKSFSNEVVLPPYTSDGTMTIPSSMTLETQSVSDSIMSLSTDGMSYTHDLQASEEDATESYTASTQFAADDVPRTPKKPGNYLDLTNPSLFTEVLFVSVGVAALSAGIYVGYQFLKRH